MFVRLPMISNTDTFYWLKDASEIMVFLYPSKVHYESK